MNTQPIYLFKMMCKALGKGIIYILKSRPKYWIIKTTNNTFIPQIFIGYWKIGSYLELGYSDSVLHTFEKDTLDEAESVVQKGIKKERKPKQYTVKEYI